MLRPRIIPCLLIHNGGLVKTVGFKDPKYVGDPLNAVRIFNEKGVDELMVVDIDASRFGRAPDEGLIASLAAECRMPLCYGGGIKSLEQAVRIIKMGVEKVSLSSAAIADPAMVTNIARYVGSQSVVIVLDIRRGQAPGSFTVWTHNGLRNTGRAAVDVACQMQAAGAGEIVLNSIDNDGVMKGYDLDLVRVVRPAISVPMTILGGAGNLNDIGTLFRVAGIVGAAAGSLFVFKGAFRAVLINYPDQGKKSALWREVAGN